MSLPEFNCVKHENFRSINVNGLYGGPRMGYVEANIYSEESDLTKALSAPQLAMNKVEVKRTLECRLVIDPIQLKSLALWFDQQVKDYERLFGRIPSPEEVANKQKTDKGQ